MGGVGGGVYWLGGALWGTVLWGGGSLARGSDWEGGVWGGGHGGGLVWEVLWGRGGFFGVGLCGVGGAPTSQRGGHPELPQAEVTAPPCAEPPRGHGETPQGGSYIWGGGTKIGASPPPA